MIKQKYWVYSSITVFVWGAGSVMIRLTFGSFSAITLAVARVWIAALTLLIICLIKKMPPPRLRDIPIFIASGAIGFAVYYVFYNLGFALVTAATGNVVLASTPLFTSLIALFVYKERIRPLGWVFTGVSFIGILILVLWDGVLSINKGVLYLLITASLISVYNIIQRNLTKRYTSIQCCAYSFFAAAILMSPFLPGAIKDVAVASPGAIIVLFFLGALNSGVAYLCWSKAFSLAKRTADVANFLYLPPFLATLLAFAVFNELPGLGTAIGGVVILFGLWMFQKKA